jgi:GTP-binding protein EngB required for normal cell division
MNFKEHEAHRAWILDGLRDLERFVQHDPDFRADKEYHEKAIGYQRRFMEDGKYRVVFLGTFNVGKSTAINAFLGGAYLPMDVEECTSKLTFIQRGERQELLLSLSSAAARNEVAALEALYNDIPATIQNERDGRLLRVLYESDLPDALRQSLEPLVTVMADEDFPHLAPLREKIDELNLYLPSSVLEEDIIFVDTPGVHSVSETRQEITYGIIEHSHLVVCFVDSGLAGNIHDLNFIKRIITWRGRRVFFVLNKADKLESDEIDIRGSRGPAWSLLQAFKRHGIPEAPEIFFLSGYRALRAQQLELGHLPLDEILEDNRVSIPTSIGRRLEESNDPTCDLAAYLMGQSRLPHLKERLLDFLLNENKAGAVIETAAKFVWERADEFVSGMDNELALAKHPARFDELRANRGLLLRQLEEIRANATRILAHHDARAKGGQSRGEEYPGYTGQFRRALTGDAILREVINPVMAWLRQGTNLRDARRCGFRTLSAQIEHQVDEFVSSIMAQIHRSIDANETETRAAIAAQLGQVRELRTRMTEPGQCAIGALDTNMASSYIAFGAGGAMLGAAVGAAVGTSVIPVVGTAIGAGLGGLLGVLGGLVARLARSEERWIKKLEPVVHDNVMSMLVNGGKDKQGNPAPPIMESVIDYLGRRAHAFHDAVDDEVNNAIASVQRQIEDLLSREEEIRRECDLIIERLQPKADIFHALRDEAERIINEVSGQAPYAPPPFTESF